MLKDAAVEKQSLFGNIRITVETHASTASYLTLLLATRGIMIGLFTVTGFINRTGSCCQFSEYSPSLLSHAK
ncbi:MAG: hypothetical protein JRE24_06660 [Deltaproteobacteria bacterium]|nr:hypothetical protein [Deltaproteobacteria bacterium]